MSSRDADLTPIGLFAHFQAAENKVPGVSEIRRNRTRSRVLYPDPKQAIPVYGVDYIARKEDKKEDSIGGIQLTMLDGLIRGIASRSMPIWDLDNKRHAHPGLKYTPKIPHVWWSCQCCGALAGFRHKSMCCVRCEEYLDRERREDSSEVKYDYRIFKYLPFARNAKKLYLSVRKAVLDAYTLRARGSRNAIQLTPNTLYDLECGIVSFKKRIIYV